MVIYFIYSSVYVLIPNSYLISPPSPLGTINLFSMTFLRTILGTAAAAAAAKSLSRV